MANYEMYKIAWLHIQPPEIKALAESLLPEGFRIEWMDSKERPAILKLIKDADFIIHGMVAMDSDMIHSMEKCKMIVKCGAGIDAFDLHALRECRIPLSITAGGNSIPVAEYTVGLMLCLSRWIPYADRNTRSGTWNNTGIRAKSHLICGKKIGLVGLGNIGTAVSRMLSGFGADIRYYKRHRLDQETEAALHIGYLPLKELYRQCDIISLHLPATEETYHMVGREEFELMKETALFVNVSRGELVDDKALEWALENNQIAAAGIDVFEQSPIPPDYPLCRYDNVILTPHIAGSAFDNMEREFRHAYGNIMKYLNGERQTPNDDVISF